MAAVGVVLAAFLAVAVVLFAARPFLREPDVGGRPDGRPRPPPSVERLRLAEERDRALVALRELEFDHRTGKISDADYREQVGELRCEAALALRALDPKSPVSREAPVRARD